MQYARSLRFLKAGWTPDLRKQQLEWFLKAANYQGGASFTKFIEFIRNDSLATFTDAEMALHADLIAQEPESMSVIENLGAMFAGRSMTDWTMDDLGDATRTDMKNRDFENGKKMFSGFSLFRMSSFWQCWRDDGP